MSQVYRVKKGFIVQSDTGAAHTEGKVFVPTHSELEGNRHALEKVAETGSLPVVNQPSGTGKKKSKAKPMPKTNIEDEDADS